MGLDVSHDCWHGAYSAFYRFRIALAEAASFPKLEWMQGFYVGEAKDGLPISWEPLKSDPLTALLDHSDCEGDLQIDVLLPLAKRLEGLAPSMEGKEGWGHLPNYAEAARQFAKGLRLAAKKKQVVKFG